MAKRTLKLLFIAESFPISQKADFTGGVEACDYYVAKKLARKHQVMVITGAREGAKTKEALAGIQVFRVGSPVVHENRERIDVRLNFCAQTLRQAFKLKFDLVQGSNVITQFLALVLGRLKRSKTVALIPDIYLGEWIQNTNLITGLVGEVLERIVVHSPYDQVISWSNSTKNKLISKGTKPGRISVIYGGVEVGKCQTLVVKKYKRPTVTFAARLVEYKRAQDLIRAIDIAKSEIPDLELRLIGSGPYRPQLEALVDQLSLHKHVRFLGFIPKHEQVLKTIKRSTLFSLPSAVEGFGQVTVEAMACGVPYVSSDISPTREVTDGGQGGILYPLRDYQQLAEAICLLLTDHKLYQTKVEQAVELAGQYDWDLVVRQTETLFTNLVDETKT